MKKTVIIAGLAAAALAGAAVFVSLKGKSKAKIQIERAVTNGN